MTLLTPGDAQENGIEIRKGKNWCRILFNMALLNSALVKQYHVSNWANAESVQSGLLEGFAYNNNGRQGKLKAYESMSVAILH